MPFPNALASMANVELGVDDAHVSLRVSVCSDDLKSWLSAVRMGSQCRQTFFGCGIDVMVWSDEISPVWRN